MKERLNLTIDGELLDAVKAYASSKEMSVSELVESYFRSVTRSVKRKNILDLVDEIDPQGPLRAEEQPATDGSKPSLEELMARLEAWASVPGPRGKKTEHGF